MDDVKHMAFDSAREEQGHGRLSWLPMAIKYLFSALAACATYLTVHRKGYVMVGLLELVAIAALTNLVARRSKVAANILNGILILLLNIQLAVMVFGSDWLNPMMLLSLNSIEDLSGNAVKYIAAAAAAIGLSFLPVRRIEIPHVSSTSVLSAALGAELVITMLLGPMFSPLFGWYSLVDRFAQRDEQSQRIAEALVDGGEFYDPVVIDVRGRNTLGFAPTILDYLDVSAPNSFLGESLFGEPKDESLFDTMFWDPNFLRRTDGGQIAEVDEETAQRFYEELELYFAVKLQELAEAA